MQARPDAFGSRATLTTARGSTLTYYSLPALGEALGVDVSRLPVTVRILLENLARQSTRGLSAPADIEAVARWQPGSGKNEEFPFLPGRVVLQDFTGVPAVVDLAAMRSAVARLGGDPRRINPLAPADLVIDHSVQVDAFGSTLAFGRNVELEFERNRERYMLLRWAQQAFQEFRVVPPGTGIVHQVNLEYLASVVATRTQGGETTAFPDTLVGTDSHTTMINGLGVLGWGVGGIEAEAVLLGQPLYLLTPIVVGFRFHGKLPDGATATDLVLTVTQMLRKHGVVGKFVEFCGPGLTHLSVADRATLANMAPEYGATAGLFPVDAETLRYLRMTGRPDETLDLVERYTKQQGLFRTDETPDPQFDEVLELDLATVEPSLAGPRRPQDRVPLSGAAQSFRTAYPDALNGASDKAAAEISVADERATLNNGAVVIAAITSCTNTSNPMVMVGAGLLAKKAVERGLRVHPYVKTSLAPGSRVVTDYLEKAGLLPYLEALRFHVVGYGCTTCIAEGTPVLLANGTTRRIEQMPGAGGVSLLAPTADGRLGTAVQTEMMVQGERECVSLVLQDGRTLVCTPDHEILCSDGRWVRVDQLVVGRDRVVVGYEAPLDEPGEDEAGYRLPVGTLTFTMDTAHQRQRTLAFARLLGHLLSDGSISLLGQGRINVGQAMDREAVLADIELVAGCRPAATRYDERKWSIVLPKPLTDALSMLQGVRTGRRIQQMPVLPAFVLDERCPRAVVREFLGGLFGADGHAPALHRWGEGEEDATLEPPVYSQSTIPEHVETLKKIMGAIIGLLARCGVKTEGANIYQYPTRRTASSYPAAQDGLPRVEIRLELPDGLSFVERIGYRYCMDKSLRASAAAVYWRLVGQIHRQRLWMSNRLEELRQEEYALSFSRARKQAAVELMEREPIVFPHYSLLEGHDRFSRLPRETARRFQPLHRDACDFPSPVELLNQIGARDWFAPLRSRADAETSKRYCVAKEACTSPTFALQVVERRPAGKRAVFDLAVNDLHAFIAGTVAVHNCIGNSGPLPEAVAGAIQANDMVVVSVLSGNRNFEGRIHPQVRASYLASPPLVVAYALAGTIDVDLTRDPVGHDPSGNPVYLTDIWPTPDEVRAVVEDAVRPEMFAAKYGQVFEGDQQWQGLPVPAGDLYEWDPASTYIQEPPFFKDLTPELPPITAISGARVLAMLGDSVTTDHISPAGSIPKASPAGAYLLEHGVQQIDFNSYGARRGNHEVMMRGTFGNIRLRNELVPGKEGYWTALQPGGEVATIYDAAQEYQRRGVPLLVIAGKEYGSGSSRDWAAKGTLLLGVKAVIAESYERIHRSNLVGMGVLPLQFLPGEGRSSLGLTGGESYEILGLDESLRPGQQVTVRARRADGGSVEFQAVVRIDSPIEVEYYRHGGVLPYVLRQLLKRP
ncbi:MAG TPA: aconitate hydratase AcnA [Chloroflexota bacterium]|nr:aconitate hydratase AcnA [Chloroflexota bacterium]